MTSARLPSHGTAERPDKEGLPAVRLLAELEVAERGSRPVECHLVGPARKARVMALAEGHVWLDKSG